MSALAKVVPLFPSLPTEAQRFILFWYRYPRRINKVSAQRAWARLGAEDQSAALEKLPNHVKYWQQSATERRFIPYPATWLNGRRWEDEIEDEGAPLVSLGRCDWNRNGTRGPGGRCKAAAVSTAPAHHGNAGSIYCAEHARMLGIGKVRP